MEKSFGVICEGPSDFRIIKRIIESFFKGEDPTIVCYQPKQLPSGKSDFGGWTGVLGNCRNDTLKEIFEFNNYAIIQIDTDCLQDKPFNVPHIGQSGKIKSDTQLCDNVIAKLNSIIFQPEIQDNKRRILFAVCIHSIECWLLPVLYSNNRKSHTTNCINLLNLAIQKKYKGMAYLNEKNKNEPNGIKVYDAIIANWKRKTDITAVSLNNAGFQKFVESLTNII
ncbi:MAG: hypothetical protein WCK09_16775 [Bacteroidota bacterium]